MDSRERCIKAIKFGEIDKVPTVLRARPEVIFRIENYLDVDGFDNICLKLGVDVRFAPGIHLSRNFNHLVFKEFFKPF